MRKWVYGDYCLIWTSKTIQLAKEWATTVCMNWEMLSATMVVSNRDVSCIFTHTHTRTHTHTMPTLLLVIIFAIVKW